MNKHLTTEEISKFDDAVRLRKAKGISRNDVAKAMGYKSDSSIQDIELLRNQYSASRISDYIEAVRKLARLPQRDKSGGPFARVVRPVSDDVMAKLRRSGDIRKASGVQQFEIAHEMTEQMAPQGHREVTGGMVCHFEKGRRLNPERAKAYIAAVEKLCANPQISFAIPAPAEPKAALPTTAPIGIDTANASITELLAIRNRCDEGLARHRAAWAAMMGRDDAAAWEALIAQAAAILRGEA
jgi:hypothetical protein